MLFVHFSKRLNTVLIDMVKTLPYFGYQLLWFRFYVMNKYINTIYICSALFLSKVLLKHKGTSFVHISPGLCDH